MKVNSVVGPGYQKTPGNKSVRCKMALACSEGVGLYGFGIWVSIGPKGPIQEDRHSVEDGHEYCIHLSAKKARSLINLLSEEIENIENLQRRLGTEE
jgi:hypothetical protein